MREHRYPFVVVALSLSLAASVAGQGGFEDPAPPTVAELPPQAAPAAERYDELRSFGVARPIADGARVEDWPSFLGPRRDGRCRETGLLAEWPKAGLSPLWTMQRGEGYASPVVQGQRLVFTHRVGGEIFVDCLHAETGERYWRHRHPTQYRAEYFAANGPCSTPVLSDDRVFVHGIDGTFHCLELATGRIVWQRDLKEEFELQQQFFGVVTSPLLRGDRLIVNLGARGGPTVIALDARTGRVVWGAGKKWGMSCASPVVRALHGTPRLFVVTGGKSRPPTGGLLVLDPDTGAAFAEFPFRSRRYESVNGVCPIVVGQNVVLTSNYSTGTVGVGIGSDGGATQAWKVRRLGIEFSNPVVHDGHLYLVDGVRDRSGAVVCVDPLTGKELARTAFDWDEQVELRGKQQTMSFGLGAGSLLHVGGDRFLCLSDNGHLLRLACTPEGAELLDRCSLFRAGETWTPLVVSHGLLYVCQNRREKIGAEPPRLMCYDLRGR